MAICAMALTTSSCDFEEVNTNQFEMTEEEGTRDDFAVGGLITALEKTVFPVGTQADDTGVINQYQIAFNPNRSLEKVSCHFLMTAIRKTALYMLDL